VHLYTSLGRETDRLARSLNTLAVPSFTSMQCIDKRHQTWGPGSGIAMEGKNPNLVAIENDWPKTDVFDICRCAT
jgi:hypothetical protein